MATYKPAAHIADIRGSIQNTTYSRNRLGGFLKIRKGPMDRRSLAQLQRRAAMRSAVDHWNDILSAAQRQTWNDLSLLTTFMNSAGIQFHPSGFNLFLRQFLFCEGTLQVIGLAAPGNAASPAPTFTIVATAGANIVVTADAGWCGVKAGYVRFFISPRLRPGRSSWSGPWLTPVIAEISDIDDDLPAFIVSATPSSASDDSLYIIAKAVYTDGVSNTITWPQFIPLTIV